MIDHFDGLIMRQTTYGDNDLIVNVLTPDRGKVSVRCRGVRSLRSPYRNIIHPLFYNSFVVYEKNGMFTLKEAGCLESFYDIGMDITSLSLAQYVLEAANELSVAEQEHADLLRLCLNTLYALTKTEKPRNVIKAAFELRAMCISGMMPDLSACCECQTEQDQLFLDTVEGNLICSVCLDAEYERLGISPEMSGRRLVSLTPDVLRAMRYIVCAPPNRLFSFSADDETVRLLGNCCEMYFLNQVEHGFSTLTFYKSL